MTTHTTSRASSLWLFVMTFVTMFAVLLYLAVIKGNFENRLVLNFQTDSADSLFEGMKVSYKGFEVGKLTRLELNPKGEVHGQLEIRAKNAGFFTLGSQLKISKEKIVTAELVLHRDESQHTALTNQASIDIVRDDITADLSKRLDPLLDKFQLLLNNIADPHDGIQANLHQSREVMAHTVKTLEQTTQAMQTLGDEQKGLPAVLNQTRDTMQSFQPTAQQATVTLKELQKSLAQTQDTLQTADKLLQDVDGTVQEVQSAPLYRWLVPKKKREEKSTAAP